MSTYYVGPFGLPGTTHPYQLPPPRASAPLQFGSDPFLHQRTQGERTDLGGPLSGRSSAPSYQPANEQLPSVSQLLTPTAQDSRPSSPYHPVGFGFYASPNGATEPSPSYRHHDSGPVLTPTRNGVPDHQLHSNPLHQRHPDSLPPLARLSPHNLGREPSVNPPSQVNSPAPSFPQGLFHPHGFRHLERDPDDSGLPESPDARVSAENKNPTSNVRSHVVDERYIDGEGLCYIYADGTRCPKIIDGVPVNANWGITKAGKPRKRLAQACLTCREKKIKCQPNLPKCDQCQKSGRECRFESAPRGHRAATKASQPMGRYEGRDSSSAGSHHFSGSSHSLYSMVRASGSSTSLPRTNSQSPISDGSMLTPSAVDSTHDGGMDYEHYRWRGPTNQIPAGLEDPSRRVDAQVTPDYSDILTGLKDLDPEDPIACDWRVDPYEMDPELTLHYVETYFTYVNDRMYYMFPRRRFLLWLRSSQPKSLDDHMLLYSMMTLGSVFSERPDRVIALKRYSRTARYAVEHSRHSLTLQLAQSRIIMSLWYYAIGALVKSWDAVGAAVRTVCGLRYNVELGGVIVDQSRECEYGLHPQALIECRRRTFWVAFLMDRLSCFYTPSTTLISSQTAYLRLPCREEVYEAQQYTTVPYFQSFLNQLPVSLDDELSGLSAMALLIDILSLWGEVSDHVFRLSLIPAEAYSRLFGEFHANVVRRSDEWTARLPDHLTFTAVNMERSIRAKKADAFISIHLLYHATLMKLNRHARSKNLPDGLVDRYIHATRNHAVEILRISVALMRYAADYESSRSALDPNVSKGTLLNPFLGYVILSAVDVLSADGLIVDLPECIRLIGGGLEVMRELSRFWASTVPLVALIDARLDAMTEVPYPTLEVEGKIAFRTKSLSLDSQVRSSVQKQESSANEDLLYEEIPRERLFVALGVGNGPFSEDNILWMRDPPRHHPPRDDS
ncbi:hypothetical protein N8T08_005544 [Aspergillus melleus]|uniref:Uncharacterized protein n=1 Tax=Aspergillus melleus TaxID=138277 RepID=A0ACC3B273_9EURO|nr:hypothetical protein N8T08_005544 [Aspergillus melleus]